MKRFHQTVHSADADVNAIVTLKDKCYFVSTETLVVIGIDLQDQSCNLLILFSSISWLSVKVLVIGASVNAKNLTENLDVMLEAKLVYRF